MERKKTTTYTDIDTVYNVQVQIYIFSWWLSLRMEITLERGWEKRRIGWWERERVMHDGSPGDMAKCLTHTCEAWTCSKHFWLVCEGSRRSVLNQAVKEERSEWGSRCSYNIRTETEREGYTGQHSISAGTEEPQSLQSLSVKYSARQRERLQYNQSMQKQNERWSEKEKEKAAQMVAEMCECSSLGCHHYCVSTINARIEMMAPAHFSFFSTTARQA